MKSKLQAEIRRGPVELSELRELASFLLEQVQTLNTIAKEMDRLQIAQFDTVDGVTKGRRGQGLLAAFTATVSRSLVDTKYRKPTQSGNEGAHPAVSP